MNEDVKKVVGVSHLSQEQKEPLHKVAIRKIRENFFHFLGWSTEADIQDKVMNEINNKGKGSK